MVIKARGQGLCGCARPDHDWNEQPERAGSANLESVRVSTTRAESAASPRYSSANPVIATPPRRDQRYRLYFEAILAIVFATFHGRVFEGAGERHISNWIAMGCSRSGGRPEAVPL